MKYVIGADIGTSGTKAVLYDQKLNLICEASKDYPLYQPHNGWAMQNPKDWAEAVFTTIKQISKDNQDKDILGIGLSGQMHGLVLLDTDNNPLMDSIIWCDTRADKECNEILNTMPDYPKYTLNPPIVGFTLPKLLWVKNNLPDIYSKINKILLPKDYVNFCLTGEYSTDVTDASGTGYFDVAKRCWSKEVLNAFGIKEEWLPKVFESQEVVGTLTQKVCKELELKQNVVVVAGAGDQAAAGLGNEILFNGDYSISLGSSGVVFTATNTPTQDKLGRVHTFCHAVPNMWHIMGVTQGAGLSVKWFKDNFAKDVSYKSLDKSAENLPIGSNGLIFLPYLMGERTPHLDSTIRGAFIGLSAKNNLFDMYKSVIEGVNFSLRDCAEIMKNMGIIPRKIIVGGGGAKSEIWLNMLADILGENLCKCANSESGTKGVATLALVGSKTYLDIKTAIENFDKQPEKEFTVNQNNYQKYSKLYPLYVELYKLLAENNKKLQQLNAEILC